MIITILCGGSGSSAIQKGLHTICPHLPIHLLINGYDDGKSTGVLRKVFPNTLGISDFRKNQLLEYKLLYGDGPIYKLLNHRFTEEQPCEIILSRIRATDFGTQESLKNFLIDHTTSFFQLEASKQIVYEDFSFMNIIYCSLLNDNNMNTVCEIIKKELGLQNTIYVNSNECLILKGVTKKGRRLENEASIVDFNDPADQIVDIYFDKEPPMLDDNTKKLLLRSDIIVFSCGTQFSSLIPTYKTRQFKETIQRSKASKFLVLNCDYDKDIIHYSGNELLDKINESLPLDDVQIMISKGMNQALYPTDPKYNYIDVPQLIRQNHHDGFLLWKYIFNHHFRMYYNHHYLFDYDYTLFDKDFMNISIENIELLKQLPHKTIITNNCYSNLLPIDGINVYSNISNLYNNKEVVDKSYLFRDDEIEEIRKILPSCTNRNYLSISIKPVWNREERIAELRSAVDNRYDIIKTGKTTIEITKKGASKRNLLINKQFLQDKYTYITDINDIHYTAEDKIRYLQVSSVHMTNVFLKSIIMREKYDACIVVGGINQRMEIDYPKCLVQVKNEIVLDRMIRMITPHVNRIFVCGSNYYKEKFQEFDRSHRYDSVTFLYFGSIDGSQTYPKGNGETIDQWLKTRTDLTRKVFIMWGDVLLSDPMILEEMYNRQYDTDFLIPTIYEPDPYAYVVLEGTRVKKMEYKRNVPVKEGYHDQCVFLCDRMRLQETLPQIKRANEMNLLDVVEHIENVTYYETIYGVKSFNTKEELERTSDIK